MNCSPKQNHGALLFSDKVPLYYSYLSLHCVISPLSLQLSLPSYILSGEYEDSYFTPRPTLSALSPLARLLLRLADIQLRAYGILTFNVRSPTLRTSGTYMVHQLSIYSYTSEQPYLEILDIVITGSSFVYISTITHFMPTFEGKWLAWVERSLNRFLLPILCRPALFLIY